MLALTSALTNQISSVQQSRRWVALAGQGPRRRHVLIVTCSKPHGGVVSLPCNEYASSLSSSCIYSMTDCHGLWANVRWDILVKVQLFLVLNRPTFTLPCDVVSNNHGSRVCTSHHCPGKPPDPGQGHRYLLQNK
jgi:hypothetical protein